MQFEQVTVTEAEATGELPSFGFTGTIWRLKGPLAVSVVMLGAVVVVLAGAGLGSVQALVVGEPQLPTPSEGTDVVVNGHNITEFEEAANESFNEIRTQNGESALPRSDKLSNAAEYHSRDMIGRGYYGSRSPDGTTVRDRFDDFGYVCWFDGGTGAVIRVQADRRSSTSHLAHGAVEVLFSDWPRDGFLAADEHVGVGAYAGGDGYIYLTVAVC